jgi:hypothetical protein
MSIKILSFDILSFYILNFAKKLFSSSATTLRWVCETVLVAEQKSKSDTVSPLKPVLNNFVRKSGRSQQAQRPAKKLESNSKLTYEKNLRLQV